MTEPMPYAEVLSALFFAGYVTAIALFLRRHSKSGGVMTIAGATESYRSRGGGKSVAPACSVTRDQRSMTKLPLELPAAPTAIAPYEHGVIVTFADHPPMIVREQFGTLAGFVIEPVESDE